MLPSHLTLPSFSCCMCPIIHYNSQEVLKPHAYQANLDIWTFYTENNLSRFPPYDCELMSHVDLTLEDITRGYFSQSVLQGLRPLSAQEVASNHLELELIKYERLKQQTLIGHTPSAGVLPKGWKASWYQLQDHCSSLLSQLAAQNRPQLVSGGILLYYGVSETCMLCGAYDITKAHFYTCN